MAINELPEIIPSEPGSRFLDGERRRITERKRTGRETGEEERNGSSFFALAPLFAFPPEIRPFFANKEPGPSTK